MDMSSPDEQPSREVLDPRNYNTRSPAVKRLLREAMELAEPGDEISAQPLEDNLFEWHFTIRGAPDSDFAQGIYHGRIILPMDYPMKPPSIILLTPNGRFDTGTKICLSISSYHPETWRPSWSIRTALVALISFMTTDSPGAIGSLEYPSDARRSLARKSLAWECPTCGPAINHIKYVMLDSETMNNASAAQRLFRIPHKEDDDRLADVPTPPEILTQNEEPPIVGLPADDAQAGDAEPWVLDPQTALQAEELFAAAAARRHRRQDEMGNAVYGLAFGTIAIGIGSILVRRVLMILGWGDVFGFFQ